MSGARVTWLILTVLALGSGAMCGVIALDYFGDGRTVLGLFEVVLVFVNAGLAHVFYRRYTEVTEADGE